MLSSEFTSEGAMRVQHIFQAIFLSYQSFLFLILDMVCLWAVNGLTKWDLSMAELVICPSLLAKVSPWIPLVIPISSPFS